jgi:hypothetical protein
MPAAHATATVDKSARSALGEWSTAFLATAMHLGSQLRPDFRGCTTFEISGVL